MSDVETKLYNLEERIKPLEEEIAQNIRTEKITLVHSHNPANLTVV